MENINTIQKIAILILVFLVTLYPTSDEYTPYMMDNLDIYMIPLIVTSIATFFLFKSKE